jgi:hypothetical protein
MDFKTSWGMLTGKIPKSEEYHQLTAANQAHQVASQHDDPGGNIYNAMYQNAYSNSLANNMPNTAAQNNGSGDRPRSSLRNPQAGGLLSFFGGGSRLGDQPMTPQRFLTNFIPGVGILRGIQRATGNQPYTMNTQSGSGAYDPSKVNAMIAASQTPQSANPGSMSRAQASSPLAALANVQKVAATPQYGAQTPPVQTSPLLGYGFEEDKFGFDPRAPRATLDDIDFDANPGYSQIADGKYVPSYNPFEASTAAQDQLAPDIADLTLEQWLQTEQGSQYNSPDIPQDFVRRMFEVSKRLNAGKF